MKGLYGPDERHAMSVTLCRRVMEEPVWQTASCILLYHPLPDEVDVTPLIEAAYREGRRVILPVCQGDDLILRCYEGPDSLQKGAYGIMEPTGKLLAPEAYHDIDLAIIPGMAFDGKGHRLGRGKGFYDRLLPSLTRAFLMGICFPFQFVREVPSEAHDSDVRWTMYDVR